MASKKLNIITGLISLTLFATLIVKLIEVPGGMILSGLFIGGVYILGILLGCIFLSKILKPFLEQISFITIYSITTAICFLIFHYILYSPKIIIIVPKGYVGRVNLVLSNVDNNILNIDTNGIGYITEWTFDHTYIEPTVVDIEGKSINADYIGFNPSTFWSLAHSSDGKIEIHSLSFEIVPNNKMEQKQYHNADLFKSVDKTKLK